MESGPDREFTSEDDVRWFDLIDARDMLDADVEDWFQEPTATEVYDASIDELELVNTRARRQVAERYRIIGDIIAHAADNPDPWVGADPTLDPLWVDPRERTAAQVRAERRDMAVRAAVCDVAVRLRMSEMIVRNHAAYVDTLRTRCPKLWASFLGGSISEQNAVTAAKLAGSLPRKDPASWVAFDEQVSAVAGRLTPAKFHTRARSIRERVHAESLQARHQRAAEDRGVWVTAELDGMAYVTALLPADKAYAVEAELDATAHHLHGQPGETRTLAQLRADVFADTLASSGSGHGAGAGSGRNARPTGAVVAITVPVMTLLGEGTEPAILDGYGPIDLDTAKRIAGSATSWVRILTHPITGTVLDVDRRTYRVPKALKRWLGVVHPVCVFPGCSRPARECDLDHILDWQYGGKTKASNLGPDCARHHPVKHGSNWTVSKNPDTGQITWTSPTGHTTNEDPPPF